MTNKAFVVEITETYSYTAIFEAESAAAAGKHAETLCDTGEIDMDRNHYDGRSVTVKRKARPEDFTTLDAFTENNVGGVK